MDISSINSDLIRGNVTTIILGSLWSADRYGYDILKEIESKSDGQYKLKQPTLYNQLKRLEKQGLISSYDGEAGDTGGGKRRYFTLTAEGRNFLQKEKHEYEYSRTILDKLVSANDFDFSTPAPFDTADLRPYAKKDESEVKPKIVYKDKVVEVEKLVEVEKIVEKVVEKPVYVDKTVYVDKPIYFDSYGNEITAEDASKIAENAKMEAEKAKKDAIERENAQNSPSQTLDEIFAKLEAKSEYERSNNQSTFGANNVANNQTYKNVEANGFTNNQNINDFGANNVNDTKIHINPFSSNVQDEPQSAVSIKEVFAHLDERGAEIDSEVAKKSQQEAEMQQAAAETSEKMTYQAAVQHATNANVSEMRDAELERAYAAEQEKQAQDFATQQSQGYGAQQSQEYNKQQSLQTKEYTDAEIISKNPKQAAAKTASETQYAVSAVLGRRDNAFEFEKENVNYRDFFSSITSAPTKKANQPLKSDKFLRKVS
ncbi:MAG: PadR family transcriptional regulator [Clostridia bacterium]